MRYSRFKDCVRMSASPAVFFVLGIFFMRLLFLHNALRHEKPVSDQGSLRQGGYKLINPLLLCDYQSQAYPGEFSSLKKKLNQFIDSEVQVRKARTISVYFRDLLTGRWTGINENDTYTPASLLKVPTMIAFLKGVESDPALLTKKIAYGGGFDYNAMEVIKPPRSIEPGHAYTVDELLRFMIVDSDNNAYKLLSKNIDKGLLIEAYTDLGLSVPPNNGPTVDFMSPKEYSNFFRVLYNATYLNRALSEKALEYLSEPDFPQGIESGVPSGVTVAQKFGERTQTALDGTVEKRELHDCGIVFYPGHPYVLCVMTSGLPPSDFNDLTAIIHEISAKTYQEVKAL